MARQFSAWPSMVRRISGNPVIRASSTISSTDTGSQINAGIFSPWASWSASTHPRLEAWAAFFTVYI